MYNIRLESTEAEAVKREASDPSFKAAMEITFFFYVKTGYLYSSKFSIHVVDLSKIELATEEF